MVLRKNFKELLQKTVLGLLIGSLAIPSMVIWPDGSVVYAGPEDEKDDGSSTSDATIPDLNEGVDTPAQQLDASIAAVQGLMNGQDVEVAPNRHANGVAWYLAGQTLEEQRDGRWIHVAVLNGDVVSRDNVDIGPKVLETDLSAGFESNLLYITYRGAKHRQVIDILANHPDPNITILDVIYDAEYITVLLSDGTVLTTSIGGLRLNLFSSNIPLTVVTRFKIVEEEGALATFTLRENLRQVQPTESHALSESADIWPDTSPDDDRIRFPTAESLELMRMRVERTRPLPAADEYKDNSPPREQSGGYSLVRTAGGITEEVDWLSRVDLAEAVVLSLESYYGALALTLPNGVQAHKDLDDAFRAHVADFAKEALPKAFDGQAQDVGSLLAMAPIVQATNADGIFQALQHAKAVIKARTKDRPDVDTFTRLEREEAFEKLKSLLDLAEANHRQLSQSSISPWLKKYMTRAADLTKAVMSKDNQKALVRFLLRKKTIAISTAGVAAVGTALALDLHTSSIAWMQTMFPIYAREGYPALLWKTSAFTMLLPALPLAAGWLASFFNNFTAAQTTFNTGARLFIKLFHFNPFKIIAKSLGQSAKMRAAALGISVPSIANGGNLTLSPLPGSSQGVSPNAATQNKVTIPQVAEIVAATNLEMAKVRLIAAVWVAAKNKMSPEELLAGDKLRTGGTINFAELEELSGGLDLHLAGLTHEEIQGLLKKHAEEFLNAFTHFDKNSLDIQKQLEIAFVRRPSLRGFFLQKNKARAARALASSLMAKYNETLRREGLNVMADPTLAAHFRNDMIVDFGVSLFIAMHFGAFANALKPESLRAQPGALFGHRAAFYEDANQVIVHTSRHALAVMLSFASSYSSVNIQHKPLEATQLARLQKVGYQNFLRDLMAVVLAIPDLANVDYATFIIKQNIKSRAYYLQATLLNIMVLRMLVGKLDFADALLSSVYFMFGGLFTFGWPWMIIYPVRNMMTGKKAKLYREYEQIRNSLAIAIRTNESEKIQSDLVGELEDFYRNRGTLVDRKEWNPADKTPQAALDFALQNACVEKGFSKFADISLFSGLGGVITGVLATHFMLFTFSPDKMQWIGSDHWRNLLDWNYIGQMPANEGVMGVMIKTGIVALSALGIQSAFRSFWNNWLPKHQENPVVKAGRFVLKPVTAVVGCMLNFSKGKPIVGNPVGRVW